MPHSERVYMFGYYGFGNAGDEAMRLGLAKILQNQGYYNICYYQKGGSFWRILSDVWDADIVVLGGGTHLRNWGHGWLTQSLRILGLGMAARAFGKSFYMVNVGIDGQFWRWCAKQIATKMSIRDDVSFDSAAVLDYVPKQRENILGVALTPVNAIYYQKPDLDDNLLDGLMPNLLKAKKDGWSIVFFSLNAADDKMNKHAAALTGGSFFHSCNPRILMSEISRCSAFVGMRYHSNVFAYMTQTPTLIINTYPSCKGLADKTGLPIVDMNDVVLGNFFIGTGNAKLSLAQARDLATIGGAI